jgi:hypothetical protein
VSRLRNQDGFVKAVLVLAILGVALYAGSQLGMPYFRYVEFKHDVGDILLMGLGNGEKIRADVVAAAEKNRIPIEDKDIIITSTEKTVRVKVAWSVDVDLWGLYQKTFDFTIDAEQ